MAWESLEIMLDGAQVVEHVLGRDRLGADAALGEGHVVGHLRVQVVADHEHVELLAQGVDAYRGAWGWWSCGSTFGWPATLMMSGAWPPPAPSVW